MSEENKAIARRLIEELFNTGNQDVADVILAADYVDHSPSHPDLPGPQNVKLAVGEWRDAFPDTRNTISTIWSPKGIGSQPAGRPTPPLLMQDSKPHNT